MSNLYIITGPAGVGKSTISKKIAVSKKKSGYSPVCKNEFSAYKCDKPRVKCNECPYRDLLPLTELSNVEKNEISERRIALEKIKKRLLEV